MSERDISQAPVIEDSVVHRLITTNAVARWLAHNIDARGELIQENITVGHTLEHLEAHETARLVHRETTAAQAIDFLMGESPPVALLVTHNGRRGESVLGVIVQADLPKMQASLGGAAL